MKELINALKSENIKIHKVEFGDSTTDSAINLTRDGNIHISLTPYAKPYIYQLCEWDGEAMEFHPFKNAAKLIQKAKHLLNKGVEA